MLHEISTIRQNRTIGYTQTLNTVRISNGKSTRNTHGVMLATNALSSYSSVSTQKFVTIRAEMLSILKIQRINDRENRKLERSEYTYPARVDAERDTTTQPAPENVEQVQTGEFKGVD